MRAPWLERRVAAGGWRPDRLDHVPVLGDPPVLHAEDVDGRVPITAVHGEPSPFGVQVGRPAAARQRGAGITRIREQRNRDGLLLVNEMPRDWRRSVIRVSRAPTE